MLVLTATEHKWRIRLPQVYFPMALRATAKWPDLCLLSQIRIKDYTRDLKKLFAQGTEPVVPVRKVFGVHKKRQMYAHTSDPAEGPD